jgi:Mn-dependent DtxR family transcriptional regulator
MIKINNIDNIECINILSNKVLNDEYSKLVEEENKYLKTIYDYFQDEKLKSIDRIKESINIFKKEKLNKKISNEINIMKRKIDEDSNIIEDANILLEIKKVKVGVD